MPAFFLLSAYEVSNLYDNSGFAKEKQISYPGISWGGGGWWLRSGAADPTSVEVGVVASNGLGSYHGGIGHYPGGYSPAFNLDLSKVLFTSPAADADGGGRSQPDLPVAGEHE